MTNSTRNADLGLHRDVIGAESSLRSGARWTWSHLCPGHARQLWLRHTRWRRAKADLLDVALRALRARTDLELQRREKLRSES